MLSKQLITQVPHEMGDLHVFDFVARSRQLGWSVLIPLFETLIHQCYTDSTQTLNRHTFGQSTLQKQRWPRLILNLGNGRKYKCEKLHFGIFLRIQCGGSKPNQAVISLGVRRILYMYVKLALKYTCSIYQHCHIYGQLHTKCGAITMIVSDIHVSLVTLFIYMYM